MSGPSPTLDDPRQAYRGRVEARRRVAGERRVVEARISWARLALFLVTAALVWPALFTDLIAWGWILVPSAVFIGVALWHARVIRLRELDERAADFYERGLERLDDRWAELKLGVFIMSCSACVYGE